MNNELIKFRAALKRAVDRLTDETVSWREIFGKASQERAKDPEFRWLIAQQAAGLSADLVRQQSWADAQAKICVTMHACFELGMLVRDEMASEKETVN